MSFLTIDTISVKKRFFSTRPQGSGSIMIWAEKSSICFVDDRMNSNGYREVLKNHPVGISGSDWIFQEDNARSKVSINWSKSRKTNVLS